MKNRCGWLTKQCDRSFEEVAVFSSIPGLCPDRDCRIDANRPPGWRRKQCFLAENPAGPHSEHWPVIADNSPGVAVSWRIAFLMTNRIPSSVVHCAACRLAAQNLTQMLIIGE